MRCLIAILCCAMLWSWGSWWPNRGRDDDEKWGKWGPDPAPVEQSKDSFTVILLQI
jgi:hypothetical protein